MHYLFNTRESLKKFIDAINDSEYGFPECSKFVIEVKGEGWYIEVTPNSAYLINLKKGSADKIDLQKFEL